MASRQESVEITQFTSTAGSVEVPGEENMQGSWADDSQEDNTPLPDALKHLVNNGFRFKSAPFWSSSARPKLVKS